MQKIKITLPASLTNLGPGLNSLGLAVALYTTIEVSQRSDDQLLVDTEGEGAGRYGTGLRHPVALALMRMFQRQERALLGLTIKIANHIPPGSGLGAEAAFWVAGVIAANNLMGTGYSRTQLLEIAAQISGLPSQAVTAMMGGLTASFLSGDHLIYRTLDLTRSMQLIIALPELASYETDIAKARPDRVLLTDALFNLSRTPLLLEALRQGDLKLVGQVLEDRLFTPYLKPRIAGYDTAAEIARRAGAVAVSLAGDGPALVAFAESNHKMIAEAIELAFENAGIKTRTWIVPVDTQGVVISVVGSS